MQTHVSQYVGQWGYSDFGYRSSQLALIGILLGIQLAKFVKPTESRSDKYFITTYLMLRL